MKPCNSCGKCCTRYGSQLSATKDEIQHWEDHHPGIFRYVNDGRIWADPETGAILSQCPFLYQEPDGPRRLCRIYEQRPEDCRFYPSTLTEMIRDECEMLEPGDLRNSRRARKSLERLMADSHSTSRR